MSIFVISFSSITMFVNIFTIPISPLFCDMALHITHLEMLNGIKSIYLHHAHCPWAVGYSGTYQTIHGSSDSFYHKTWKKLGITDVNSASDDNHHWKITLLIYNVNIRAALNQWKSYSPFPVVPDTILKFKRLSCCEVIDIWSASYCRDDRLFPHFRIGDWKDISTVHVIIIINSEVSTFPMRYGKTGNLFSLLLCSLWWVQIFGYVLACRSYSFVCTVHHLSIIIVQTYLKALNL